MTRLTPQLVMVRKRLDDLPEVALPAGCVVRHFAEGDEPAWEKIIAEAFERRVSFEAGIRNRNGFSPQRVLFIIDAGGAPIATASAMPQRVQGDSVPGLHMVGVLPSEQGRRLGYWVSLAAMHRLAEEGAQQAYLLTDDFRLPAVKTYLRLGFEPHMVHANQPERWRRVLSKLGCGGVGRPGD